MTKGDKKAKGRIKNAGKGHIGADGPLDRSPSHLLHRVLQRALDIYSEAVGPDGPTQRQFAVLTAVARNEGLTQTGLVRATGIDRSTLADLVARMITKGLLARERSKEDGRANAVRLTDAGRAALEQAEPNVALADERILALLPKGKRDAFLKILASAARAAAEVEERKGVKDEGDKKPEKALKAEGKPAKAKKSEKSKKASKAAKAEKKAAAVAA